MLLAVAVRSAARSSSDIARRIVCTVFKPVLGLLLLAVAAGVLITEFASGSMAAVGRRRSIASRDSGRINTLQSALQDGTVQIPFAPISGYLQGLLRALNVPIESQVAVFSRASAQGDLVSPDNPRVIYFSDDVAVGWVRGSSVIEVAESDPDSGVVFYIVRQDEGRPKFIRSDGCRSCHQSDPTLGVPGLLVLSTPQAYGSGANIIGAVTDHRTPFEQRWGGWYVTGRSSGWRHLGNRIGQGWLLSLYDQFYDAGYLSQYSDAVALMVLEHQTHMTNLFTVLSRQFDNNERASDIRRTVQEVVDYMLFIDEARMPAPIIGTSGFAEYFSKLGPRDNHGRSLRKLDLRTRLFQYPCSYTIYSHAFEGLPHAAKDAVYGMLFQVLSSTPLDAKYARLTSDNRRDVLEILTETKPEFAELAARARNSGGNDARSQ